MANPVVSVVLPVYNGERFVAAAVESILSQSFTDFELIIVDDASTDGTAAILSSFRDKRIKMITHKTNRGNYPARNTGWKKAAGKFISVMDADDIALPCKLKLQWKFMVKHPRVGMIGSYGQFVDAKGQVLDVVRKPVEYPLIKTWLLQNNCFIHSSMFIRNELAQKYYWHYNERFTYASDYELAARFAGKGQVLNLDEVTVCYRIHAAQISKAATVKQTAFADKVRLQLLRRFAMKETPAEQQLHLQLMKGEQLPEACLQKAEQWANRLLLQNCRLRLYRDDLLYELMQNVLLHQLKGLG